MMVLEIFLDEFKNEPKKTKVIKEMQAKKLAN